MFSPDSPSPPPLFRCDLAESDCAEDDFSAAGASLGEAAAESGYFRLASPASFLFTGDTDSSALSGLSPPSIIYLGGTSLISKLKNLLYRPTCSHLNGKARGPKASFSPSGLCFMSKLTLMSSILPFFTVSLALSLALTG